MMMREQVLTREVVNQAAGLIDQGFVKYSVRAVDPTTGRVLYCIVGALMAAAGHDFDAPHVEVPRAVDELNDLTSPFGKVAWEKVKRYCPDMDHRGPLSLSFRLVDFNNSPGRKPEEVVAFLREVANEL
jgi:hypothetical protein